MGKLEDVIDVKALEQLRAFAAQNVEAKDGAPSAASATDDTSAASAQDQDAAPAATSSTDEVPGDLPGEADIVALWDWDAFQADFPEFVDAKALDTDADPSPNRGAAKLRAYWTRGPGAAKIGWGSGGDFLRCVAQLGKYVSDPKGLCNVYHTAATGNPPGKGHKNDDANPEVKTAPGPDGAWDFDATAMGLLPSTAPVDLNAPTGSAGEYKEVGAQVIDVDKRRGIVTAIVSVTGREDRVKDVIHAGAYRRTLAERVPKGVWSHSWEQPVSKTLESAELHPGDTRLPKEMRGPGGTKVPWPKDAGGLLVKTQFNLLGERGKQAFADVVFFDDQQEWSIGYNVPPGGSQIKGGVRHIYDLDLYEYSPVLFGAMPAAATVTVKSAQAAWTAVEAKLDAAELQRGDALRAALNEGDAVGSEQKAMPEFIKDKIKAREDGDKKPGKGEAEKNEDGSATDAKKPHKFAPVDGKCKVCGLSFGGHMKAQKASATGDEKSLLLDDLLEHLFPDDVEAKTDTVEAEVKVFGPCPTCSSTAVDVYTDGTAACENCRTPLVATKADEPAELELDPVKDVVETKVGRVLSGAVVKALKEAQQQIEDVLRRAGEMDEAPVPAEVSDVVEEVKADVDGLAGGMDVAGWPVEHKSAHTENTLSEFDLLRAERVALLLDEV